MPKINLPPPDVFSQPPNKPSDDSQDMADLADVIDVLAMLTQSDDAAPGA